MSLTAVRNGPEDAARLRRWPLVYASVFAPAGRRTRPLMMTGPCAYCSGRHAHFASEGGARRAGCGAGIYWIVVARRYSGGAEAAA